MMQILGVFSILWEILIVSLKDISTLGVIIIWKFQIYSSMWFHFYIFEGRFYLRGGSQFGVILLDFGSWVWGRFQI